MSRILQTSAQMSIIFCRPEHYADSKAMSSAYKKTPNKQLANVSTKTRSLEVHNQVFIKQKRDMMITHCLSNLTKTTDTYLSTSLLNKPLRKTSSRVTRITF